MPTISLEQPLVIVGAGPIGLAAAAHAQSRGLPTVVLEAGFQVLPVYVRYTDLNPVMKTFGPPAILLVWNYVMANVLVFGAELNWWVGLRREPSEEGVGLG